MSQPLFPEASHGIARVALPVPVDALFDYSVPSELEGSAEPGRRVLVRFRERTLTGVIVECAARSDFTGALRPLRRVLDPEPVLSPAMLAILRESAAEVLCPIGIAIATALPAGSTPRIASGFALTPRGRGALEAGAVRGAAAALLELLVRGGTTLAALRGRAPRNCDVERHLAALETDGLVARRGVERGPSARPGSERVASLAAGVEIDAALAALAHAPRQAALLRRLAELGEAPLADLARKFDARLVRALAGRGFVSVTDRAAPRDVLGTPLEEDRRVDLTADQSDALKPIEDAVRARRFESFLLHGVTGSGKTEIYLRAVGAALGCGRQALVLVPEITLTHQILARLRGRFGDRLAVLHSGLRPGERLEQWQRLRAGATPIAVGARSALFAPLENLGIIVIDEEHDGAYKNEEGFRYHGRDLARLRARHNGCPVVLGSATPALETRYAADCGELRRLVLPHRIGGRPLPAVEIVDLVRERERMPRGRKLILSAALRRALADTLDDAGQAILFLNRRGFSTQVMCFECGHAERCPHCDVTLVYHAREQRLRCHYCDHAIAPPEACTSCGRPDTALLGLGTERVEEEVRTLFPRARIDRLDRDTASRRGFTEQVLRRLQARELDVLIGTQMVAKGHDFPGVRLVGVVAADVGLHLPDFRAAERTFQLLTQVAGRAGRDTAPGRVIVQTFVPSHYAIRPVRDHDYETFYEEELGHRASLGFPPFGRLAYALVSAPEEAAAREGAALLARAADDAGAGAPGCERLGPAPAPLARLRGRHRVQLFVKGHAAPVRDAARAMLAAGDRLPEGVQAVVDLDPRSML